VIICTAKVPPLNILLTPPVLGQSLDSVPIEEVLLLRDEMADMAWGIERTVASPLGSPAPCGMRICGGVSLLPARVGLCDLSPIRSM
jgi:hypothetical protein